MTAPTQPDADTLVTSARARPTIPWVETSEAYPDIGEWVLLATDGEHLCVGYRGEMGVWYNSERGVIRGPVRWWSRLPLLPQTGTRG